MFLLLTHPSSSCTHGLCILAFSFQQSNCCCLMLLLDLELSFSLIYTIAVGSFGKGLSLMWDTHPILLESPARITVSLSGSLSRRRAVAHFQAPCPGPPQGVVLLRLPTASSIPSCPHSTGQGCWKGREFKAPLHAPLLPGTASSSGGWMDGGMDG